MRPGIGAARGQGAAAADEMAQTAGARLRARRRALRLTQSGLADALGVSTNTVARWERGEQRLRQIAMVDAALDRLAASVPTPPRASGKIRALPPVFSTPGAALGNIPA